MKKVAQQSAAYPDRPVLIVDDEPCIADMMQLTLRHAGISNVQCETDSRAVLSVIQRIRPSVVLLDLMMPHISGRELLPLIRQRYPDLSVIVSTALAELATAVECMQQGACDYLTKPVEGARLIASLKSVLTTISLQRELDDMKRCLLEERITHPDAFAEIVTNSAKMQALFRYAEVIARSSQPILVSGETGTGKELMARALHRLSGVTGQLVTLNVAGLDDVMFSDTLFGHRKGAYTGAEQQREGMVQRAGNGILFLDEIGDLSETSQVKLLRLLQEGEYYQVGSDQLQRSNARFVLATNRDLQELVRQGKFRSDLYYRLNFHRLHLPALRERQEDIPMLVGHFLREAAAVFGKEQVSVSPAAMSRLKEYSYPGNVRELQAVLYDAVALTAGASIAYDAVRFGTITETVSPVAETGGAQCRLIHTAFERFPTLREVEDRLIDEALKLSGGHLNTAASMLGITRQTVSNHLRTTGNRA